MSAWQPLFVTVWFQHNNSDKLPEALKKFGFEKVFRMPHRKWLSWGKTQAYCAQIGQIDSCLAIKDRGGETPFLTTATEIILGHHEKWDGSGYPYGLTGEQIPLAARVVALADVYDALTSERVYKPALSHVKGLSIIKEAAGSHFDPKIVAAFLTIESAFRTVATRLT